MDSIDDDWGPLVRSGKCDHCGNLVYLSALLRV
jgi:hypothetical protein